MSERACLSLGLIFIRAFRRNGGEHRVDHVWHAGAGYTGQRMDLSARSDPLLQLAALCARRLGVECIALVEPDNLRFLRKAVTILGEFFADCAVGANDIVESAVHQVKNDSAALDVAEETSADTSPLARSLDQSGEVGQDKRAVVQPHDA
jgi:hypothetical protein